MPLFDDLSSTDKALWAASSLGLLGDYAQTRQIAQRDDRYERNPVLGRNPSTSDINKYFGSLLLGNAALTQLPPKYRRAAWGGLTAAQLAAMAMNKKIGIGFKF